MPTVPSENKKDQRTIEQVLADSRAKKRQKTEEGQDVGTNYVDVNSEITSDLKHKNTEATLWQKELGTLKLKVGIVWCSWYDWFYIIILTRIVFVSLLKFCLV